MLDAATAQTVREIVAKGAMPPLVLVVDDCRAAYDRMRARGVEFTQEPVERYGTVDAELPRSVGQRLEDDRVPTRGRLSVRTSTSGRLCTNAPSYINVRPNRAGASSEEVTLNWNKWIRQIHRWLSVAFTLGRHRQLRRPRRRRSCRRLGGPDWPLIPLILLLITGLYMFVLPYATRWRSGRSETT